MAIYLVVRLRAALFSARAGAGACGTSARAITITSVITIPIVKTVRIVSIGFRPL
jgi:hypothetical protein